MILALLAAGANPNTVNQHGERPLTVAASLDKCEAALQPLLEAGAEINGGPTQCRTALVTACGLGHRNAVAALLAAGADANLADHLGMSPLARAARTGSVPIVKLLLERGGAAVDSRDCRSNTPLMDAAICGHVHVVTALVQVRQLLGRPAACQPASWSNS